MRGIRLSLALAFGLINAGLAGAQTYPDKPVRFVVAFAPGGPADIIGRLIGQKLGESWGQTVVIENRAGAGGAIATRFVAKAPADGYTVLVNTSSYAVNASLMKEPGYDAEKDLIAAINVGSSPNLIVAGPALKGSLRDVINQAKGGKLNYGSAGAGTTPHLTAEYLFKVLAGVAVQHIPYQGAGPAMTAAMGGQVEIASVAMPAAVALVKSGKVRGLAVTSNKRVGALPDVPTVAESGFPGFEDYTWVGLFFPVGTPGAIVERANASVNAILATQDTKDRLAALGFEPVGGSARDFSRYLTEEIKKWAKVIKETGTPVE